MVGYVDVFGSSIVDRVLSNVDTRGIIGHNRYADGITELRECVKVQDCLTTCGG